MRILSDLHHGDLFNSLHLLFEKRLRFHLYRPIGLDWFDAGYWRYVFPARETAKQFLDPNGYKQWRGLTLEEFKDDPPELILSSTPPNFEAFEKLRREHAPKAKHIFQSGNQWTVPIDVEHYLNSTTCPPQKPCNEIRYHQEFELSPNCSSSDGWASVVNLMHYMPDRSRFAAVRERMPAGWVFKAYGAGNHDGPAPDPVAAIRFSDYLWHAKPVEAYGFNVHRAAAFGIPILMRVRANQHQTCGAFLRVDETCLDLDDYSTPDDLAKALLRFDAEWGAHAQAIKKAFSDAVDFEEEELKIRRWLQRVIS